MPHALIIDDDFDNTAILAELLSLEGVDCTQIQQPEALPQVLAGAAPADIIFLDLEMPKVNGYEALTMIQRDQRHRGAQVVAYTVHLNEINAARERGFHSFLAKPLDADAFPDQLARILRGERVWTRG